MKTINKRCAILFIAYIEVTFLNLQHKIQLLVLKQIIYEKQYENWFFDTFFITELFIRNKAMGVLVLTFNKSLYDKIKLLIVLFRLNYKLYR